MGKSSAAGVRDKDAGNAGYGPGKFGPKFPPPCVGKGGRDGLLAVLISPCGSTQLAQNIDYSDSEESTQQIILQNCSLHTKKIKSI
jgi:hypothetical protein